MTIPNSDLRREFEDLALPLAPVLHRTACRLTRTREEAADLVQDTFLRAYRTFSHFDPGTNAKAWLFTILYSIVSNKWRHERQTPQELSLDEVDRRFEGALVSGDHNTEMTLLNALGASSEIYRALAALPAGYRAAVLLVDVEDLTYEEAARALACPIGTVRSRVSRARKLLFLSLREYAVRAGVVKGER